MVPNIFISYSYRDEVWRNELVRHLRVLERGGILRIWDTSEIQAGTNWSAEIRERLNQADHAVILVSPDALASDSIVEQELPALIHRQRAGEIVIVPVGPERSDGLFHISCPRGRGFCRTGKSKSGAKRARRLDRH
jgi:hypothetical protein